MFSHLFVYCFIVVSVNHDIKLFISSNAGTCKSLLAVLFNPLRRVGVDHQYAMHHFHFPLSPASFSNSSQFFPITFISSVKSLLMDAIGWSISLNLDSKLELLLWYYLVICATLDLSSSTFSVQFLSQLSSDLIATICLLFLLCLSTSLLGFRGDKSLLLIQHYKAKKKAMTQYQSSL